jgi:putative transposase
MLLSQVMARPLRIEYPGAIYHYKATAGLVKAPSFLTVDWILAQFGKRRAEAQREYMRFVQAGMKGACPWEELKAQCILGGKEFIEKLKPAIKDKSKIKEIPRVQRLAFRPSLEELLPPDQTAKKKERNKAIEKAYFDCGYTLSEIAKHLGMHYATIGRIIKARMS